MQELVKRAEDGDAEAQDDLGNRYADGEGVAQDDAEAATWYQKAAEQGDVWVQGIGRTSCVLARRPSMGRYVKPLREASGGNFRDTLKAQQEALAEIS